MKGYDSISIFPHQSKSGWFTITPMLEDLDSLAARIGQMVQFTRQLQTERTALQARVKNLEQERDSLRDQLHRHEAENAAISEVASRHQAELDSIRAQAEAAEATLQVEASRYRNECEALKHRLVGCQADTTHLRDVAGKAREQIDSILMRLPGAVQE